MMYIDTIQIDSQNRILLNKLLRSCISDTNQVNVVARDGVITLFDPSYNIDNIGEVDSEISLNACLSMLSDLIRKKKEEEQCIII